MPIASPPLSLPGSSALIIFPLVNEQPEGILGHSGQQWRERELFARSLRRETASLADAIASRSLVRSSSLSRQRNKFKQKGEKKKERTILDFPTK